MRDVQTRPTRRNVLAGAAAAVGAAVGGVHLISRTEDRAMAQAPRAAAANKAAAAEPFGYCFNTSTIRAKRLPIVEVVEIAAKAGWQGVEPWIDEIERYVQSGKPLADLRKRIADLGLQVPSVIGFAEWIVDDDARRARGLEQAKRDMDWSAKIGGTRMAAPPVGAHEQGGVDLFKAAERYHALCELGDQMGVVAQVEVWGFSKVLQRLGEAVLVAVESKHPKACVLIDPYHLYK